ncbi:MAG: bifunctional phosphopantothenoylcysteine decarboxylase/phosphopantothenate--cysteine ligase CoaBC [Gammaproteobacteria bacterium]|nr:MAG: bifunctional phosphopantothenoylcysteine decarboxylase/phosphopantothenate--cysteine ligase CoaBC [Gammaproteobacteria bacterium]RKZ70723.1 MAG: bifunctional phosphopantothenoylcysteine decarboxylase/phosphopantothenate--cysteine ligase CoaBC [Gammaproteobacteria bacterium]
MNNLTNKRILLGVTGGIAAYKSAELVRRLREQGAEVRVVMTRGACEFITPLTMQALSGREVHTELLDHVAESGQGGGMGHIELARWCDVVLVAPASANFIARLSHGMADDLLSTLCLATTAPVVIAPAMNQQMWMNIATQENIATLGQREIRIAGPAEGEQACGEIGPGRMLEPEQLILETSQLFSTGILADLKIVVTAGPTREAIDPVRYITNHSSGQMGYAVARAAAEAGADVTLVSGPVSIEPPRQVRHISVDTADQMRDAVMSDIITSDIFVAAAAVADYRCADVAEQKIKKKSEDLQLLLQKNPDILAEVASLPQGPFTVGFAAETENLLDNARIKLQNKKLDMIAANQVGEGLGFNTDENELQVFWQAGEQGQNNQTGKNQTRENQTIKHQTLERAPKEKLARHLIKVIANHYYEKYSAQTH